jgi:hypothetical protein
MSLKSLAWLLLASAAGIGLLLLDPPQRAVAAPAAAALVASMSAFMFLWRRDGELPLFDVGIVCLAFVTCYVAIPPVMYLLSGMEWTILSDSRLKVYDPSPEQFGAFAWMPASYVVSLAAAYVACRGRAAGRGPIEAPDRPTVVAIVSLALLIAGFFVAYQLLFDVDISLNQSYELSRQAMATGTFPQVPLVIRQVAHNLYGMLMVLKYAMVLLLVRHWRHRWCRYALPAWLAAEGVFTVVNMGSRSWYVFLLLSAMLAYHRIVRPLRLPVLALASVLLVAGALGYGFVRDYGNVSVEIDPDIHVLSANTEFHALYGTPYDLLRRKEEGSLPRVPWQVYLSDLLMLVPQQALPFQKIDPGQWYLELLGIRGSGQGFMFGVVSQGVIGLGTIELVVRGALTGFLLAMFHRWYARRTSSFWATLLYLWLCIWSYYCYRATSFYVATYFVYRFVPAWLLATLGSRWLRGIRNAGALAPAP